MRLALILAFGLTGPMSWAQGDAYVLGNTGGAELVRVDLDYQFVKEEYWFDKNEVRVIKHSQEKPTKKISPYTIPLNSVPLAISDVKRPRFSVYLDRTRGIPIETKQLDSVQVAGRWYRILITKWDDGFIGGLPSSTWENIAVEDIGNVYYSFSHMKSRSSIMICHEDSTKHELLIAVYKHLTRPDNLQYQFHGTTIWDRMVAQLEQYRFEDYPSVFLDQWYDAREHLKIISSKSETIKEEIHYSVTIKNSSDTGYFIPKNASIGPSKAVLFHEERTEDPYVDWDLLDTHSGHHYQWLNHPEYIKSGEEVTFSWKVSLHLACGNCDGVEYSGFQIYRVRHDVLSWFLSGGQEFEGKPYLAYPFRVINK